MEYKSERFVKPVDENLFCSICHEVFQDPVSCKDGHTFCINCIELWLKTSNNCPLDNNVITDIKLVRNYIVKGIIDNLEVYCHLSENDTETKDDKQVGNVVEEKCSWIGRLQDAAKHRDVCGFQLVQCTHPKCTVKEQRRRIEDHMKTCKNKVIVCARCRVTMIQNDKELHAKDYCPKSIIPCPKGCLTPSGMFTEMRSNAGDSRVHLTAATACDKALVDCPFKDQGCLAQVERQHVDKHVQDNMAAHMMLLAKENKQLKEELNHAKETLKKSKGSYVWITNGGSESPIFLECGHRWKLFLYYKRDDDFISFYLNWFGDIHGLKTQDITAFVRLSVLSNTPEKANCTVARLHSFTKAEDTLEFRNVMKKIDAELPAYIEGGLNVRCSIQLCYSDN